ncbi:dihydrodipicolinate synthase family protein [Alcaligenes sp. CHO6]|uniref:dihydrodipicolinate synthase family protein n=1 Tax=Alcaligenes sp. CHO6 TaxID=3123298 RepID=UPI0030150B4A
MKNKGVFSICPTPFKPGGELDLQSLVSLVNFQLEAGIHGLAILGVMGELHKLSTFERRRVIETVVAGVRGAVPVWVGVRAMGTAAAVEQARSAEDLGADAIFVAPLAGADDEMQVSFYRQIVQAIRIPVVIHDFPELFAARISPALAVRLKEEAGVSILNSEDPPVGQKITAVRGLSGDTLPILSGLGGMHFLEELQRGADGVVTGFSFPEILLKVYALYRQGEQQEAARVFDRYCSLIRYEFQPLVALALRKYSYMRRGIIACDATRDPATALDHLSRDEFEAVVRRVGLDLSVMGVQTV